MGGLGNQLFQIFATIAYAKKYNMTVVFPYSKILTSGIKRPTYWHSFLKDIEKLTTNNPDYETVTRYLNKFVTRLLYGTVTIQKRYSKYSTALECNT